MKEQLCVLVLSGWDLNHNTPWQEFLQHVTGLSYPTMLADLKGIYISVTSIPHYSVQHYAFLLKSQDSWDSAIGAKSSNVTFFLFSF